MTLLINETRGYYRYEVYTKDDFSIDDYTKDEETKERVLHQIAVGELSPYLVIEYEKAFNGLWERYNSCPVILQTDAKHALKEYLICSGAYD